MSAPASDEMRSLAEVLVRASDSGDAQTVAELREEVGVGTAELAGMLDTLREHGQAVEVEPGVWTGPDLDAAGVSGPAPVLVSVQDEADDEDETDGGVADSAGEAPNPGARRRTVSPQPTVRLTAAVVDALNNEALGALVKAAMPKNGDVFILEVVP